MIDPVPRTALIAIVDDDDSVRAAMSSLVRSLGHEACVFASAEDFLASSQLGEASLLIADVQMPGMSGLDLQRELHTRQHCVPVVFITAFPEERLRKRAAAAGAIGFFSKPVDSQQIIGCIDAALGGAAR